MLPAPPSVRREGAAAPVFFSLKTFTALQKRDRISRNRPRNRSICPGAHSLLSLSALAPIFCQDHSPPPSAHALVFPLAPTKTTTSFQDVCVCVCVCAPFNLFLRLVGALTDSSVSLFLFFILSLGIGWPFFFLLLLLLLLLLLSLEVGGGGGGVAGCGRHFRTRHLPVSVPFLELSTNR